MSDIPHLPNLPIVPPWYALELCAGKIPGTKLKPCPYGLTVNKLTMTDGAITQIPTHYCTLKLPTVDHKGVKAFAKANNLSTEPLCPGWPMAPGKPGAGIPKEPATAEVQNLDTGHQIRDNGDGTFSGSA